jgi:hypothetical protein
MSSTWTCQDNRSMCCSWKYLHYRGLCSTLICLHCRGLCCSSSCLRNSYSTGAWAAPGRPWASVACSNPIEVSTPQPQEPELQMDVSTPQEPELQMDVSTPWRGMCCCRGVFNSKGAWAAPGRVWTTVSSLCCSCTYLHYKGLCCTRTCLHTGAWTCLNFRVLCCTYRLSCTGPELALDNSGHVWTIVAGAPPGLMNTTETCAALGPVYTQGPELDLDVSTLQSPGLHLD